METQVQDALANTSPNVTLGADTTVQGSVASIIHSLSGEPLTGVALAQPHDRPGEIFTSMSLPIDARVTPKLKAKIWANEFINFGKLITVTPNEEKFNISIDTSKESPGQPIQKAKNISTIAAWTSAFQVFVGIYTSVKHPSRQTEQAQTIVLLVLIYNLERGRIKKRNVFIKRLIDRQSIFIDLNFNFLSLTVLPSPQPRSVSEAAKILYQSWSIL